jgi:hypothetical protein
MEAINRAELTGFASAEPTVTAEAIRVAQYNSLNEAPGLVFAILTLVWVIASFAQLF